MRKESGLLKKTVLRQAAKKPVPSCVYAVVVGGAINEFFFIS